MCLTNDKSLIVYANHALLSCLLSLLFMYYQAVIFDTQEDMKHIYNTKTFFFTQFKTSSPKEIKNCRLIKNNEQAKNLQDAIEEINKIEELETEIIIEFTKKTQCYRKKSN